MMLDDVVSDVPSNQGKKTIVVPRGTSSYQAAWMINELEEEDQEQGDNQNANQGIAELHESDAELEEIDMENGSGNGDDESDVMDDEEERRTFEKYQKQRKQELQDAINFPDEVDTPLDIPARERFARYRALESFRTSRWDPYENLPVEYAKIYQFQNVSVSAARALEHSRETGVEGSQRITLNLKVAAGVDPAPLARLDSKTCPVVFGLLRHEHKTSVMHFRANLLKRSDEDSQPIKSKDEIIVWTGIRLLTVRPVFSENSRGNLHKMLRYVRGGETVVGSFYGPIQFESAPAILFQRNVETGKQARKRI